MIYHLSCNKRSHPLLCPLSAVNAADLFPEVASEIPSTSCQPPPTTAAEATITDAAPAVTGNAARPATPPITAAVP